MKMPTKLAIATMGMVFFAGCGSSDFTTSETIGRVLCDGQPVANAAVYFEPLRTGESALVGKQGFSWTDENGEFKIATYNRANPDGAVVGKHRVRVGRGEAKCDCEMDDERDLMQVEIKSGEVNEFELVLTKPTKQTRRRNDEEERRRRIGLHERNR